ncbi:MAG TPA: AmmeMemoRadiSam system protein A [Coriobacteriia bacterium]
MSFDVLGIIAPHPPIMVEAVGGSDAAATERSASAMRSLHDLLVRFAPETVVIVSPHAPGFADTFTVSTADRLKGDLGRFGARQASLTSAGDPDLASAILEEAEATGLATVAREQYPHLDQSLDHGVLVPMSFLDPNGEFPLVVVSFTFLSAEDHIEFGRCIRRAASRVGRRIAMVASGDCSHRLTPDAPAGFAPRGRIFDEQLIDLLSHSDWAGVAAIDEGLRDEAGECGWRSFLILSGFLEDTPAIVRVLAYEGPWGVGYLTAAAAPPDELAGLPAFTPARGEKNGQKGRDKTAPVRLARTTIESYVRNGTFPSPDLSDDPGLPRMAGAFVSLHSRGDLRGCIGTIAPTKATLAEEIAGNAVQAATSDPRFPALRSEELEALEISVDVLHEPEPVGSLDDLDPKVFGVIVTAGRRRGLLLPDLDGVDTAEQQVRIARHKAGIADGEPISLERFKVDRYE